jgi:3-hydroxyacyl-CoA dehydrogenase
LSAKELRERSHVAIVGAGEMGSGIATVCALAGYRVVLSDLAQEVLQRCLAKVQRNLEILVEGEQIVPSQATDAMSRVRPGVSLEAAVAEAGLMIEAVPESLEIKQGVFKNVEALSSRDAVLASNASGIPTTDIAALCARPEWVVGIHFFNPPYVLRAVEAIRGEKTSDETFQWAIAFIESLGSVPIRVLKARRSFVINALQQAIRREATALIEAGVTTREDIDRAAAASFGIKYATFGLLRSADLTSPMSPLRAGEVQGNGLNYDYEAYGAEETFRRRDLAFIEAARASARARETHSLQ